jgi:hypothetical protein
MQDRNQSAYRQPDGQKIKEKWAWPIHVSVLSCAALWFKQVAAFNAYCAAQSTLEKARFERHKSESDWPCLAEFLCTSEKVIEAAVALPESENPFTNRACRAVSSRYQSDIQSGYTLKLVVTGKEQMLSPQL